MIMTPAPASLSWYVHGLISFRRFNSKKLLTVVVVVVVVEVVVDVDVVVVVEVLVVVEVVVVDGSAVVDGVVVIVVLHYLALSCTIL